MLAGGASGLLASLLNAAAHRLHVAVFGAGAEHGPCALRSADPVLLLLLAPAAGGLLLGLLNLGAARRWPRQPVDPIEAALHGGCMSLTKGAVIDVQDLVSNGGGASVGPEAAHAQVGAAPQRGGRSALTGLIVRPTGPVRSEWRCGSGPSRSASFALHFDVDRGRGASPLPRPDRPEANASRTVAWGGGSGGAAAPGPNDSEALARCDAVPRAATCERGVCHARPTRHPDRRRRLAGRGRHRRPRRRARQLRVLPAPARPGRRVLAGPRFERYRLGLATVDRVATGLVWAEGPAWLGATRLAVFSDVQNKQS